MATNTHTAKWGVGNHTGLVSGVTTSFELIADALFQQETDESGAVCRMVHYDTRYRATATVQIRADAEPPAIGGNITIDSRGYVVIHVETIERNMAFKKIVITAEAYEKCGRVG